MSWHCSQALVAEYLAASCSDGARFALLSSTPTPETFYWPDKTTEHSRLSRFGMTCEPLTADLGAALLRWFLAASRAKTSAQPARAMDWTASAVGFGRKWLGSLARFDPASRSWKTHQHSLLGGLDEFSEIWPRWGSMRTGECWERMMLELHIDGNASGLWPTPVASDTSSRNKPYAQGGTPLSLAVKTWPTPRANDAQKRGNFDANNKRNGLPAAVKRWPTPQASDNRDRGNLSTPAIARRIAKGQQVMLSMSVSPENGRLNPNWVEWLMGWPIGLSDLQPLETGKFRAWQQQHGESSPTIHIPKSTNQIPKTELGCKPKRATH